MRRYLLRIATGFAKVAVLFVLLSVVARYVGPVNWFFFQKNEHDRVFYVLLEAEKLLAEGKTIDMLVLGSSVCENNLDPKILADSTGFSVFKMVTGGQTIDLSIGMARFLAPRLKSRYVVIDLNPRFGGDLTDEGVERAVINSPDATSQFTRAILAVDPSSATTDFLWLSRAIGTAIKPYGDADLTKFHGSFDMVAPGFSIPKHVGPSKPEPYSKAVVPAEAMQLLNAYAAELKGQGKELIGVVPSIQNTHFHFEEEPTFRLIQPADRPDTCFFDARHMLGVCVPGYTAELARLMRYQGIVAQTR